jgi:SWI/SNF-related matrix-associated actin-dependent regulator 1 of chromatin subfamily A
MTATPAHLHRPPSTDPVGKLVPMKRHDGSVQDWMVEASPGVTEVIKRLFPGSSSRGSGVCRFPNTKRNAENLNWIMLRYPLEIADPQAWEESYQAAVQHAIRIREFNKRPEKATPPPEFVGTLREFQKEGLSYLVQAERALLADEMGLGKTVMALAFLAAKRAYPAVIVVPPHLVKNWRRQIDRFLRLPSTGQASLYGENLEGAVHVIKGLRPYALPPASIYLVHYLLLRGWKNALMDYRFQAVIFDEIQELRHTGTEKYSAASLLASATPLCVGLSGTPIYNRGGEIWSVMNIIEYHCLGDWESFTREWCYGYGSDIVRNPEQLGEYLRSEGLMLRRTKKQVLSELPPKRRVVQVVDFDQNCYKGLIQSAIEKAVALGEVKDRFERGRMTREIVNDSRRAIGMAKAPFVTTFVKMLLEADESVLLFAYHHDVWDIYREELKEFNPVFITGRETGTQKDASVQAFQAGKTNICCISLRATAGLDGLQSATCVAFGELDWSPAIHSQAEDRIHRIGMDTDQDSILCYYLVAEEGTDEVIQEFLGLKVAQFTGIMGDEAETEEDKALAQVIATEHMNKVVERLRRKSVKSRDNVPAD